MIRLNNGAVNRANVNVSPDRTASPHSRLLWHDALLMSLTHGVGKVIKVLIDGEFYGIIRMLKEFTRSQNNDSTNIIIISPNYHRIIHKNNPHFNRKKFQFEFPNGEVLRLKLYEHLKEW